MTPPLLVLSGLHKHYRNGDATVRALDGVSLAVNQGDFLAIMGPSGSGKSTLMHIIGCLDRPTTGSYRVRGTEAAQLPADALARLRRETFGFIFQRYHLLAGATASENVEIPSIYAGLPKRQRMTRATQLLQRLGLGERSGHRPAELSGGQQQRVAIARALVNDPAVILADEPTGALDSASGEEVLVLLKELHAQGRTVILITHAENVARHASRVVQIHDGRIIEDTATVATVPSCVIPATAGIQSWVQPSVPGVHEPTASTGSISLAASVQDAVATAWRSLRVNRFRTALTLLGIIIGVAAVVTMLAVGEGSRRQVLDRLSRLGTNLMLVFPSAPGVRGDGEITTLVPEDALALKNLPNVTSAVPERSGRLTVRYGNIDHQTTVQGVGEDFPAARDWPVAEGQFFNADDTQRYAAVAVMGRAVANTLFPDGRSAIGEYILVRNVPFLVIGVMAERGVFPGSSFNPDDVILVPIHTSLVRLFGKPYLTDIGVKVADTADLEATQAHISAVLKARHQAEDFRVISTTAILDTATATQNTFTLLLGTVAAISLLVGGIGVMNIMLVSVVERTREIGIRMATGARMRDIFLQFNIEAAVVCTAGGVIGIVVGILAGLVLRANGMAVVFLPGPALLAFVCACATGLIFGYLPARQAARLDPVIALASE